VGGWSLTDRQKKNASFFSPPSRRDSPYLILIVISSCISAVIGLQFTLKKGRMPLDIIGYCTTSNRHYELPKGRLRQLPIRYWVTVGSRPNCSARQGLRWGKSEGSSLVAPTRRNNRIPSITHKQAKRRRPKRSLKIWIGVACCFVRYGANVRLYGVVRCVRV